MPESIRAFKVELDLNNKQRTRCRQHAGTARFAFNWGLNRKIEAYKKGEKAPNAITLHRELNALKATEFPWMYEVSKCAPQEALRDLDHAFNHFFRRVKAGENQVGFPKFKKRSRGRGSFRLTGTIRVWHDAIQLPRLGRLRLKERGYIPTNAHVLSATVSERAGKWFVSVLVKLQTEEPTRASGDPKGVDVGIKHMATCSDGEHFDNPKALKRHLKKLKRLQRKLSRQVKGSKNYQKTKAKLARLHYRIARIRQDKLHKATTSIVAKTKPDSERPSVVVIEDLNVSGMMKNHNLARAIADVGFYEFRRQLEYKTVWNGEVLLLADRFYPSSKTCSQCGHVKKTLDLSERVYSCEQCGLRIDRDINAAVILRG